MRHPPWLLEPINIWRAYRRLDDARVRGNSTRILTDIVMLVRYALGLDDVLEPLPSKIAGKFNLWLGREQLDALDSRHFGQSAPMGFSACALPSRTSALRMA
jgi:hypothetical protein